MKFFHIKYECHDARVDFRTQRLKDEREAGLAFLGGKFVDKIDAEVDEQYVLGEHLPKDYILNAFKTVSDSTARKAMQMAEIEATIDQSGWLSGYKDHSDTPMEVDYDFVSGPVISHDRWRSLLQEKHQQVLRQKSQNIPSTSGPDNQYKPQVNVPVNDVKQVDLAYLTKDYSVADNLQNLIKETQREFSLNKEQRRAFRIIANHSVSVNKAPLHMYIGGMGGTGKSQVIKALISFFEKQGKSYAFLITAPTGTAAY